VTAYAQSLVLASDRRKKREGLTAFQSSRTKCRQRPMDEKGLCLQVSTACDRFFRRRRMAPDAWNRIGQ
jgi:hypothetical protein